MSAPTVGTLHQTSTAAHEIGRITLALKHPHMLRLIGTRIGEPFQTPSAIVYRLSIECSPEEKAEYKRIKGEYYRETPDGHPLCITTTPIIIGCQASIEVNEKGGFTVTAL